MEHANFARATLPLLERRAVLQHFEAVKRIAALEIADWPVGTIADVYDLARRISQHYAFALIFGEPDRSKNRRFGAMIASYHAANWSRFAAWMPLDLPWTPYRRLLREADALQDFVIRWSAAAGTCPHGQPVTNVRTALTALPGATPERTAAHLAGFALASYETTASTLAWALLLLACHPTVSAALLEELEAAGPVGDFSYEDLDALPLLDGVIRETMRVVTPVPFLGFRTIKACEISNQTLPSDALVIISPHLTHRASELYSTPRRFMPERWQNLRPNAYEYLPFSNGPRRCPGSLFAGNNLKIALATILPQFKLSLPPGSKINRSHAAITVPSGGMPMLIEKQDGRFPISIPRGSFFDLLELPPSGRPN